MEQELISIVVPVYRAERYIEETMDCVRAQTYPHWELLLVEDCGPDRSREIIEQYIQRTGDTRIRMLTYSTNLGAARARNLGVNEAKGRYLEQWKKSAGREMWHFIIRRRFSVPIMQQ